MLLRCRFFAIPATHRCRVGCLSFQHPCAARFSAGKPSVVDAETAAARRAAVMKDSSVHIARGSGPGGQSINKTKNSVMIIHEPTGVAVRVQDKRSLLQNRKLAEKRLADKVEFLLHGTESKMGQKIAKYRKAKARSAAKSKAKHSKAQEIVGAKPDPLTEVG